MLLCRHPDPGSVNADPWPDPESKSWPKWPGSGSRVRTRPRMAGSGLLIFLYLGLFFSFNAFRSWKRRCKAKSKSKKQTKSNPDFFLWFRCVSFGLAYLFLCPSVATFSFSLPVARQPIRTGPNVCCVPVPIGGNAVLVGSSGQTRIRSPD